MVQIKHNKLRIPTGGRLTSWLFTQRGGVEFGATEDKSIHWQGGGLEPGTSGLQVQRPTTRPRSPPSSQVGGYFILMWLDFLQAESFKDVPAYCFSASLLLSSHKFALHVMHRREQWVIKWTMIGQIALLDWFSTFCVRFIEVWNKKFEYFTKCSIELCIFSSSCIFAAVLNAS